ncbi:MAG TPA: SRPBCC family protein [Acidimicrobiales bacterium]|jgi:uncharacterized protein YndB with AHSA1/START domain
MNERSVAHDTFVIERTYGAPPARVFKAWAEPAAKARWFAGAGEPGNGYELDFRVGGREVNRGGPPDGPVYLFDARYHEIVDGERFVFSYDMYADATCISVSVTTVELRSEGAGTRLVYTEQGAFFDGHDTSEQRREGTAGLLDALGISLEQTASAR